MGREKRRAPHNRKGLSKLEAAVETTTQPDLVLTDTVEPGIATMTLKAPRSRNSLSRAMLAACTNKLQQLTDDKSVKVIILKAEGPAFCAGHDLKELRAHMGDADGGREFFKATMHECATLMQNIVACPKPVIASVHATATAAGCQLVATCDLAVAVKEAKFCTPGVNIGLFCSTPMVALSRNVSRKHAMEMLLLGEMLGCDDAVRFGLINRAVDADDLDAQVLQFARAIASKSAHTVSVGKVAFYNQLEKSLGDAYDYASGVMVENMLDADATEGICAFLEKRPPEWKS